MSHFKQFIHEIHRRSLWQVLGIYVVGGWVVLQVVDTLAGALNLPDWASPLAFFLLVVGLPIVLATAFVQEGMGTPAEAASETAAGPEAAEDEPAAALHRLLTWRNATVGGVLAFALLGVLVTGYWVMWATGIGPVGNLVAQGVIEDGGRVVLATFDDATGEDLGNVVTEALRMDLLQASVLALVEAPDILPVLERMEVSAGTPLTADLAREVAIRVGIPAVLDGEVASAGTGYILTATLRSSDSGRSLANFRVTAGGPDEIIGAIEALSRDVREKSGESLGSIRAGKPLEQVTTSSLEALKLYTEATGIWYGTTNEQGVQLLEQALAEDSTFAMAWRILATARNGTGDPEGAAEAASMAFLYRDRLDDVERYLVEAYYHSYVTLDFSENAIAYENALRLDPDSRIALNNLSLRYRERGDLTGSTELLRRAVGGRGRTSIAYSNLITNELAFGRAEGAALVLADFEAAYPNHRALPLWRFWVAFAMGDPTAASEHTLRQFEDSDETLQARGIAAETLGLLAYWTGQLDQGREVFVGLEQGARGSALAWTVRLLAAYNESLLGHEEWATRHLREAFVDGTFAALSSVGKNHRGTARVMAFAGDAESAAGVLQDWRAVIPDPSGGGRPAQQHKRMALFSRVVVGDTLGALDAMERLRREWGCSQDCWVFDLGWLHDRMGHSAAAIELYERVRQGGVRVSPFYVNDNTWGPTLGEILHAQLRLGPLYEQVGDTAKAIEAYQRMVDQWADGDERGLRRVEEMREGILALGG